MSTITTLVKQAIADKITPGAAAAIIPLNGAKVPKTYFEGHHTHEQNAKAVDRKAIFDLASLTKIMCTGVLMAQAISDDRIRLNDEPFPKWPGVQVRHLLLHNSGLPAWKPFYQEILPQETGLPSGKTELIKQVLKTQLEAPVGETTVYSDLGFIALGHLLEQTYGQTLDVIYNQWLLQNIPECQLSFVSIMETGFHPTLNQVLPTAKCVWRGRRIHGQVHDDNAFCMGGVAGHAGLFGRLKDTILFGQWLHQTLQTTTPLGQTLKAMIQKQDHRAFAFDIPTEGGSTAEALSNKAIGHLGFTGTSFWLDPGDDTHLAALYVLLTNRVYFEDSLAGIKKLRRHFHQKATTQLTQF